MTHTKLYKKNLCQTIAILYQLTHIVKFLPPYYSPPPPFCNMNTNSKMEKPKRPLSAYNLFYRYKRILLLKVSNDVNTEFINRLIMTKPGLEGGDGIDDNVSRRDNIRETLVDNLNPNTSRRNHRAGNSKLSFLEMSKLMVASWKDIDDFSLSGEVNVHVFAFLCVVLFLYCV